MPYVPPKDRTLCFLDVETSGLNPLVSEVIEFAAIQTDPKLRRLTQMCIKVQPQFLDDPPPGAQLVPGFDLKQWKATQRRALEINGYTPKAWKGALDPIRAYQRIADFLRHSILVGHNVAFDLEYLKTGLVRAGTTEFHKGGERPVRISRHKVDTCTLAYEQLVPCGLRSLSLKNICKFLGISNAGAHRAMADVERTLAAYRKMARATALQRLLWTLWTAKARFTSDS